MTTQKISVPRYEGIVGLPDDGHALVLTNSERDDLACPHRWWFRNVERLESDRSVAMRFGTLWHSWLEELHRFWMEYDATWTPDMLYVCPFCTGTGAAPVLTSSDGILPLDSKCPRCRGTGEGVLLRIQHRLTRQVAAAAQTNYGSGFTQEEALELLERLTRAIQGWLHVYSGRPYRNFRVAAVEFGLARQIMSPWTQRPYHPETLLVQGPTGSYRYAGTGEASGVVTLEPNHQLVSVRWPWYQIGRLDCIYVHRDTGALYVGEWKSSKDPRGLVSELSVDPQTSGYCWLLEAHRERFGGGPVVGFVYDVASSTMQHDALALKGRATKANPTPPLEFSTARNRTTPSWRYRASLIAAGVDQTPYYEHMLYLAAQVDPKLHVREFGSIGDEAKERYGNEVYTTAVRLAALRRDVARASDRTDLDVAVPRVPICRLPGGGCSYRAPCLLDGDDVREKFTIGPALTWG